MFEFPKPGTLSARILHCSFSPAGVAAGDVGLRAQRDRFITAVGDLARLGFHLAPHGVRFRYIPTTAAERAFESPEGIAWLAAVEAAARGLSPLDRAEPARPVPLAREPAANGSAFDPSTAQLIEEPDVRHPLSVAIEASRGAAA